ncbi:T9SS type B sorting domain-containing protein [Aurantibacter crassamenti]|uniref:T9SS type B sorting domain-containing protein n=1 Tax=Aurantibacter crassamenti TaxID=1837375 RepID=UPI00193A01DB|nr:T9SS type B sorting domain-containing protein [Aurantibacter crassamenti]MBM1104879.1 T9SS type B sorting domain-containing protein [Aurantibacter crassamenti]
MTSPKIFTGSNRLRVFIILALAVSSLFAYVLPKSANIIADNANIEEEIVLPTHPLSGISDNVVICGNDGSEVHEIYLCGASDERLLTASISNFKQIIWSKLQEGSCTASQPNCPSTSPTCSWTQLSTNTQYTTTESGEYRIYVQYNDNSVERYYFNVYSNGLNPSAVVSDIDCSSPGSITINNVPSTYEFSINSGATWQDSNVFSIANVNSYDVQLRRKNFTGGCLFEVNDIQVNNNSIDASSTLLPITCNNSKGGIQIDINDASSTYIYEISQGGSLVNSSGPVSSSTYTFNNLDAGTYDIEIRLSNNLSCTWTATQTLPPFNAVQPSAVVTKNIDCTDGIISVTQTGGTAPYEYSVNGSATFTAFASGNQTTIPVTTSGNYTITVRDTNGCEVDSAPVNVVVEPEIIYTLNSKNITCNGNDDGSISLDVTNSQGYSTTFSNDGGSTFQTSNVFSNLASGTYNIVIKKQKAGSSCDLVHGDVTINTSPAFIVSASVTQQIDCSSGSATIATSVTSGGTAPFEYSTNGVTFQTSSDFTGLGAGDYTITVRDVNGCTSTVNQTVNAGSNLSDLTFLTSDIDCSTGETDVQIVVQGGTSPFTYRITAPSVVNTPDDTFLSLPPNTYTFEVTGDDGCVIVRNYTVPEPNATQVTATVKNNVSCFTSGTADGVVDLTVNNFDTEYSVTVEDSAGNSTGSHDAFSITTSNYSITGLPADTFTIYISDASSVCPKPIVVTVAAPSSALTVDSIDVAHLNCGTPGSVTIEASGGWGNYTYTLEQPDNTFTPFQSSKTITGLTQVGTHIVNVRDVNGCLVDTTTFDLEDRGGPISIVDQANSNYCYSSSTMGELKIDVTDNGYAPYFYVVNNGTPQPVVLGTFTLSNLTPDTYEVKVIGNNGCETIVADTNISGQLFALGSITKPLGCGSNPDANITVVPEEGYPPYTYRVDSGSGYNPTAMPFATSVAGTFTFEVTDAKGCLFITDPVEVTASPAMTVSTNISNTACGKEGTGSVELIAHGGTPPFTYSFDGSPFSPQTLYNGLDATNYNYSVRDALGCEILNQVAIVGAEDAITADVTKTDISCNPVVPPGGNIWGNTKIDNIQNAAGLLNIKLIRVSDPAAHAAGTAREWTYRNYENVDMSLPAHADGFDIRMTWAHWFYVIIEDEKGCIYESDLFEITQPPLPWIQKAETDLDQSCANGATFEVEVGDPTGLVGPFNYRIWPYDEDNPPAWRSFEVPNSPISGTVGQNEAYGEDTDIGLYERDLRISGLLFGVQYSIVILDEATGCQRSRSLGIVHAPEAPNNAIDVVSTPQSLSCYSGSDGRVRFSVTGADDTGVTDVNGDSDFSGADGNTTIKWSIKHSSDYGQTSGSIPSYRQNGTHTVPTSGASTIEFEVPNLRVAWYVVEIETESGCKSGNRFLIYRPKTRLKLELDQYVSASCNYGAQIAVTAKGGWDDQAYFNVRNKLDQTGWHEYEYAYVVASDYPDPTLIPAASWGANTFATVNPTAYDGDRNVYQVFVRDGGGCIAALDTPITITYDDEPVIDTVDVTNRCTSTNELYDIVVTLSNQGTNPINGAPSYIWDGVVTTSSTRRLGPGNHILEVKDEKGCSVTENIFIYPQMVTSAKVTELEPCSPPNSGEVTITVYGGSLDYTFERLDNSEINNTGVFTGLTHSTPYDFRITDNQSGCPVQTVTGVTIDAPIQPDFVIDSIENITCNGADDGKIVVSQAPSSENLDVTYEYSLDGITYQAPNVFDNLAPGVYTDISVRSSKNCIQILPTQTLTEPSVLVLDPPTVSPFTCTTDNGLGMATITATVDNGTGTPTGTAPHNYSFNGSSFNTTNSFEIAYTNTAQIITIDVIDANGCTDQTTTTIPAATKVTATISETQPMDCDDDAVFNVVGADGSGIPNYETRELPSGNLINGTGHGTITIPAGNPGTYVYELTDTATGCTAQVTYSVAPFETIEVSSTKLNDITCFTATDGGLEFTVTGYSGNYDYDIYNTNDLVTPVLSGSTNTSMGTVSTNILGADTFFVVVDATDAPKCEAQSNYITIQSPSEALDFTYETTQTLSCVPGSDAQITATPVGGWSGYEFELVDPANPGTPIQSFDPNNVFNGLNSGINYELTLRDSGGCDNVMQVITIPTIDAIVTTEASTNPTCSGLTNGTITVNATREFGNGHTNFSYILNNIIDGVSSVPQSGNVFSNLVEGQYSVTVTDGRGCDVTTATIDLIDPAEVSVNGAITQEPSCTPNLGEITLSATGGSGIYEYRMISPVMSAWTTNNVFDTLGPDTYEFIARDADPLNLCESPISVIRTINVVEPLEVTVDATNTIINCFGEMDAVLIAEATGGLGDYSYELQDGSGTVLVPAQTSGIFENLGSGTYRIRALSGIDCVDISENINIIEPPLLRATLSDQRNVQCFGQADGNATITVTGGVTPYSYTLSSDPQKTLDTNFFENLDVGSYTVIVQDANGCDVEVPIVITGPTEALAVTITRVEDELCSSDDNGLIELQITGGTAPYEYSLQNSSGSFSPVSNPNALVIDNLDGGAYIVYIRDANSCTENVLQEIEVGADLTATFETISECRDGQPVNITTVTVEDDTIASDVMYALDSEDVNSSQESPVFENIAPGTHYISILHSGGCIERLENIVIEVPNPLVLTNQQGGINEIKVEATGGDGNYTYYFDNHSSQEGIYHINHTDTYNVRVVDGKGCETSIDVYLEFIDIEIPNFFTPDGDGVRDTWVIRNSEGFPNMLVTIYDRYGRQIKQYIGMGEWDGSYKKVDLPTGDYWYTIKLNGPNDDREFVGHMTIYR